MNNLNFFGNAEILTKDQMKKITGGYIGCDVQDAGGNDVGSVRCSGSACACQDILDHECELLDQCGDVDCGCK